jgi:hypothetical protein
MHLLDLQIKTINFLFYNYVFNYSQKWHFDGKACNNSQEAVNKFAWSAHLDNSFESMYKYQD